MKINLIRTFIFLFFISFCILAEAQTDVTKDSGLLPSPVGGISALAGNVVYPDSAKKNKIEGTVVLKAIIDKNGNPVDVEVIKGIGHGCDEAAVKAVLKAKFKPGVLNLKPGTQIEIIPYRYLKNYWFICI